MWQFNVPRQRLDITNERTHNELVRLARDIEAEELETQAKKKDEGTEEKAPRHNNNKGWINERDDMTQEEVDNLDNNVQPIQFVLTKVSNKQASAV